MIKFISLLLLISSPWFSANSQELETEQIDVLCLFMTIKSPVSKAICDSYKALSQIKKFHDYTEQFKSDVENNETPENVSILLGNSKPKLKNLIDSLKLPDDYSFLSSEVINDLNISEYEELNSQQKSIFHDNLILLLKEREEHILMLSDSKNGLKTYISNLSEVIDAIKEIAEVLWKAFQTTGGGSTEFSSSFGYNAFDLEFTVKSQLVSHRAKLNKELKKIISTLETEKVKQQNTKSWINLTLTSFSVNLDADRESLQSDINEMDIALKYYANKLTLTEPEEQSLDKRIIANKEKYNLLKNQKQGMASILDQISRQSELLQNAQNKQSSLIYSGCENGNSFENCSSHPIKKQEFTQIKNSLSANVMKEQNLLLNLQQNNNSKLNNYKNRLVQFNIELGYIKEQKEKIDQRKQELQTKGDVLITKRFNLVKKITELKELKEKTAQQLDLIQ